MDFIGWRAEPVLETRAMQPHETIDGWILLDVPQSDSSPEQPAVFRLFIKDTAGKSVEIISFPERTTIAPKHGLF